MNRRLGDIFENKKTKQISLINRKKYKIKKTLYYPSADLLGSLGFSFIAWNTIRAQV